MRILVVEDNDIVADAVVGGLAAAQFAVERVATAEAAQAIFDIEHIDLAVIDIGLPGMNGLALVRRLRRADRSVPILMLTARSTLNDKLDAFATGADDFLGKPFEPEELVARCRALIRRTGASQTGCVTLQRMQIDLNGRVFKIDDDEIVLTSREWTVLEYLVRHLGRIVPKDRLLQAMSNLDDGITLNAVEAHVSRLRGKLGNAATIRSFRGLGYRLDEH